MIIKVKIKNELLVFIEIMLLICGIQINCLIREFLHVPFSLTSYVYLISLIIPLLYKKKTRFRFDKKILVILLYNIFVFSMFFIGGENNSGQFPISYTIYVIVLSLLIMYSDTWYTPSETTNNYIAKMVWMCLGIMNVLLLLIVLLQGHQGGFIYLNFGSDRVTLSQIPLFFLAVDVNKKNKKTILRIPFLAVSIVNVFVCSKKSIIIVLALLSLALTVKKRSIKRKKIISILLIILMMVVTLIILKIGNASIFYKIEGFILTIIDGILGILGKKEGIYNTGSIRYNNVTEIVRELIHGYSFGNIIIGKGYMYRQVDFPYLQAFTDLGLIGGLMYLWVQLVIPLNVFKKRIDDSLIKKLQNIVMVVMCTNFYSGTPYGHTKFVPLLIAIFVIRMYQCDYSKRINL